VHAWCTPAGMKNAGFTGGRPADLNVWPGRSLGPTMQTTTTSEHGRIGEQPVTRPAGASVAERCVAAIADPSAATRRRGITRHRDRGPLPERWVPKPPDI